MRLTKRERELKKQLETTQVSYQSCYDQRRKLELEAVQLEQKLGKALEEVQKLGKALEEVQFFKETLRLIVFGCKFQEATSRPRDPYGAYPPG